MGRGIEVGEKSGGVLNQVAPLYRVPEVRNAEAALAAAVKAANGTGKTTATNTAEGTTGNGEQCKNKSKTAVTSAGNLTGAIKEATASTAVGADWNLGEIWANAYGGLNTQYAKQSGLDKETLDYLKRSGKQALLGNYSGDVTALGTTLQVLSGILGLDTAADVRDLYYDVTHWDGSKEHIIQTLLDVVGLIPVVGSLKYADEVGTLVKQGLKGADKAAATTTTAKTADKQVYQLPAGYKPSLNFTDEQLAKEWKTPKSTTPSPYFTDEELLKSWKAPEKGAVSNTVEEVGTKEIDAAGEMGYNGSKGLADDLGFGDKAESIGDLIDGIKVSNGKVGGKIPVEEFKTIRQSSIKNPDADIFTMGKHTEGEDSYIKRAGKDSAYFDMGSGYGKIQKQYNLSDKEMFDYFNRTALDDSLMSKKTIRFSHNPLDYESGAIVSEWEYIKVRLGVTNANLVYRGGFWYVQ